MDPRHRGEKHHLHRSVQQVSSAVNPLWTFLSCVDACQTCSVLLRGTFTYWLYSCRRSSLTVLCSVKKQCISLSDVNLLRSLLSALSFDSDEWINVTACVQIPSNSCDVAVTKATDEQGCVMLRVRAERHGLNSAQVEACSTHGEKPADRASALSGSTLVFLFFVFSNRLNTHKTLTLLQSWKTHDCEGSRQNGSHAASSAIWRPRIRSLRRPVMLDLQRSNVQSENDWFQTLFRWLSVYGGLLAGTDLHI